MKYYMNWIFVLLPEKNIKIEDNQLALIPDEHISYQDKNIHIEMDMCKETNSTLVEKVEKYIEYAKKQMRM